MTIFDPIKLAKIKEAWPQNRLLVSDGRQCGWNKLQTFIKEKRRLSLVPAIRLQGALATSSEDGNQQYSLHL